MKNNKKLTLETLLFSLILITTLPSIVSANSLVYTVKTDKAVYTQDEDIVITISAHNKSSESQKLSFTNGCQTSYVIGGYDSSKYQMCTMALTSVTIASNFTKDWVMTHKAIDYRISTGTQSIVGKVSNQGEAKVVVAIISTSTSFVEYDSLILKIKGVKINLWKGSRGDGVINLKNFLIFQNKGPAAEALAKAETSKFFGKLTREALKEFQLSVGIKPATGNFGFKTRLYIIKNY